MSRAWRAAWLIVGPVCAGIALVVGIFDLAQRWYVTGLVTIALSLASGAIMLLGQRRRGRPPFDPSAARLFVRINGGTEQFLGTYPIARIAEVQEVFAGQTCFAAADVTVCNFRMEFIQ